MAIELPQQDAGPSSAEPRGRRVPGDWAATPAPERAWPDRPYKRLDFLEARDVALFSQRDREVEEVAALVEDVSTRIVLLHGLSGVGKSSFLRAGLVPLLTMPDRDVPFFQLRKDRGQGEAIVLRATDDPIGRLHTALSEVAEEDLRIPTAVRAAMRGELLVPDGPRDSLDRAVLAAGLTRAIAQLQRQLPGSLLLILDQAEEVLTLGEAGDPQNRAAAFFAWLEEIVRERLDMRLIVTLRTEYVGQFGARLSIQPTRTVTAAINARAGLEDYLLNALNDPERLVEIILRPTRREPVGAFPPPFETYRFTYEPGLPEQIARDCLRQARGTSALALVQVVCADLYDAASAGAERQDGSTVVITAAHYRGRGVDAALDSHIDAGIVHAVDLREPPRVGADQVERWREVLSALVARDEGGAVRTQMLSRAVLRDAAMKLRLRGAPEAVLNRMAAQHWRLLRRAPGRPEDSAGFSLGHDVLAGALARWQEAAKPRREARRSRRRARLAIAAAIGVTLGSMLLAATFNVLTTQQTMRRLNEGAATTNLQLHLPLLLLTQALNEARDAAFFARPFITIERATTRQQLTRALLDSPVLSGTYAAVGYDRARSIVATLVRDNANMRQVISVLPLRASGVEPIVIVDEAWTSPGRASTAPPVIGILEPFGGGAPVVALYHDQVLRMWPLPTGGEGPASLPQAEFPATVVSWPGASERPVPPGARQLLLPRDFANAPPWPPQAEIDGGRLHFLTWLANKEGQFVRLTFLRTTLRPVEGGAPMIAPVPSERYLLAWDGAIADTRMPVIDGGCGGRYAYLARSGKGPGDADGLSAHHAGFGAAESTRTTLDDRVPSDPKHRDAWSVAFTADCRYLVARGTPTSLRVLPMAEPDAPPRAGEPRRTLLRRIALPPELAWVMPAAYPAHQPFLAATTVTTADGAEALRVAWLPPSGVAMIEGAFALGEQAELNPTRLLRTEVADGPGWGRLAFGDDGALLFLEWRRGFADPVKLRVFDLRDRARRERLEVMTDDALSALACETASLDRDDGNLMTPGERLAWLRERPNTPTARSEGSQPCRRDRR